MDIGFFSVFSYATINMRMKKHDKELDENGRVAMNKRQQINRIHSLLRKLDGSEPLSIEQMMKYEKSLYDTIDACIPKYLFKYRVLNNDNIDSFINDKVYLSDPSVFNDPTDSMAYVDPEETMNTILGFGRIIDADDFDENHEIKINPDEDLVKRVEIGNNAISTINYIRSRVKVTCFSENIGSSLMWSHYADNHKGFALRYKVKPFELIECNSCKEDMVCHRRTFPFYPVIYKDKRFNVSKYAVARALYKDYDPEHDDRYVPVPLIPLLQKGEDWAYESEWRILCHDLQRKFISMKADALFLGEAIKSEDAIKLARIAREKAIPINKMVIDYLNPKFVLGYEDWTEYDDAEIEELLPDPREWYGQ